MSRRWAAALICTLVLLGLIGCTPALHSAVGDLARAAAAAAEHTVVIPVPALRSHT